MIPATHPTRLATASRRSIRNSSPVSLETAKVGPRGQRNFKTAVRDALQEKVTIREGDRTRSVSRMDAIIRVTLNNALRSDAKALGAFIQLTRSAGLMDEEPELSSAESISAEDEAIVAGYYERHGLKPQKARTRRPKQKKSPTREQKKKSPEDAT